jgi:protein AroM
MTGRPLLALLEIGQSPQPQMEAEFRHVLGDNCDIYTLGALDHLDENEIARHPPENSDDTLYTTLADGRSILISKRLVIDGLRHRMDDMKDIDAQVCILCCSGKFSEIESSDILKAYDIVTNTVRDTVVKGSKLGVFVPDDEQVPETMKDWSHKGYQVVVISLAPDASDEVIEEAAYRMLDLAPDTVLYDCMGYTHELQTKAEAIHSTTGIIAIGAAAHLAGRLLGIEAASA